MKYKAILFDINGTLVDILTDEGRDDIYRTISFYLRYKGIAVGADRLKDDYFAGLQKQKKESGEEYPEFDTVRLWRDLLIDQISAQQNQPVAHPPAHPPAGQVATEEPLAAVNRLPEHLQDLPQLIAEMYRAASMFRLQLYPTVEEVLTALAGQYRLAALSDAQSAWAVPELRAVGLDRFFETVVVSGDLGFRKPDPRIFALACERLSLSAEEILFVGNDMYRDVYGAQQAGMRAVYFATNQGRNKHKDTEPDYIIYNFGELPTAIRFLEEK